jgi:hypothetical protein
LAAGWCCWHRLGLFEWRGASLCASGAPIQEYIEKKSSEGRPCMTYALELKDLRKSFGKTEIIRGANLAVQAG